MPITLRLILSLVIAATAVVFVSARFQARSERVRLQEELERRAAVLAESLEELVEPLVEAENLNELRRVVERFGYRERLAGVAVYELDGRVLAITAGLPGSFQALPEVAREAIQGDSGRGSFLDGQERWHLQVLPIHRAGQVAGALVLFHDASHIRASYVRVWRENFLRLLFHVLLITLVTLLIVRWSFLQPMSRTVEWMKQFRRGEVTEHDALPKGTPFAPLAREVAHLARSLVAARAAAEEEARLRHAAAFRWTPERLKEHVRTVLQGRSLVVISNREPYMHVREGRHVRWIVPASGLVTAMEPILRACGGTWIAHGSGDADAETVDAHDKLKVPPDTPAYTLKRVWLTKEEEDGYYYGFANEGLWPLCHIAHTRPVFRAEDWVQYQQANRKFAEAALEELAGTENPCVLIQDYHFALLPRLIKEKRPDARIGLFWHIPWPNPEAFGICPWAKGLLHGMVGADLLGFHIQFHCNNFLETVDRILESRTDWEQFAINRAGHTTWVKPFPISIAEQTSDGPQTSLQTAPTKESLLKDLGVTAQSLAVGVDRIDYTKGIGERFRAVERFLEKHSAFQGQFTLIQIGAPSRTLITRYHDLGAELDAEVDRINRRFQSRDWKPIVFLKKHHSHEEIAPFYRAADVCLVTSLHDGMNLVAKEFVAARADDRGVLILSRFAGAARELQDAVLINPYDIDEVADAIYYALVMEAKDQRARMSRMRNLLQEHNVFRWAADLITELTRIRPPRDQEASITVAQ